jgi:predicted phage terminase large subunit-like protein
VNPTLWLRDVAPPAVLVAIWDWMTDEARALEPATPPPDEPYALPAEVAAFVRADPAAAFLTASRGLCQRSLFEFYRAAWPLLEPATPFVDGRVIRRICEEIEAGGDLLVNCPPGLGKSTLISVALPAWIWASRPAARIITSSYSESLALRDAVRSRALLASPWYQRRWGVRLRFDENTKGRYSNSSTGFRIATSVGGRGTGERATDFIVDDAHNVLEAESDVIREETCRWMREVVPTRVNAGGRRILVNQRTHERDASSVALEQGYRPLILPMRYDPEVARGDWRSAPGEPLFPELYPEERVAALEQNLGPHATATQLQQRPVPRGGGLFRREWFRRAPIAPEGGAVALGFDLGASTKGDRTAWVRMRRVGRTIYLDAAGTMRATPGEVEALLKRLAAANRGAVLSIPQDPGQAGVAQRSYLAGALVGHVVRFSPETGSKETRAAPLAAQCEAGNVVLVGDGPWAEELLHELEVFPRGAHDDLVDAASRCFAALGRQPTQNIGTCMVIGGGVDRPELGRGDYRFRSEGSARYGPIILGG